MSQPQPSTLLQGRSSVRLAVACLLGSLTCAPLSGCLSSAPPAPPVRYFDPRPAQSTPNLPAVTRLTAAPHLGPEIAVRIAPRELQFDPLHHWLATPRDLLAAALGPALGPLSSANPARPAGELHLANFELDLQQGVRARVVLHWDVPGSPRQVFAVEVPALGRNPERAAEAMAEALAAALRDLATL